MSENRPPTADSHKTFEQLARELARDEDEAAFENVVRKVAKAPKPPEAKGIDKPTN